MDALLGVFPFVLGTVVLSQLYVLMYRVFYIHRFKKEDDEHVSRIIRYQLGDLDPWDPAFERQHSQMRRHGYKFDKRYHEDPWDIGGERA